MPFHVFLLVSESVVSQQTWRRFSTEAKRISHKLTNDISIGSFVVCYVHLMEFLTPKWRTICGCVSLMPEGEMLLALLAYLISSWRLLTIATAAPVFVLVLFYP